MTPSVETVQERVLDITVIIDRSGSMEEIRDDAIGAFNAFLSGRKGSDPDAIMTIVLFDEQYEILMNGVPIREIHPFTREIYVPRGRTALYDAVGKTIGAIQSRPHQDDMVFIAILTDGQENASTEWTRDRVKGHIHDLEEKGWDFYYLSASLDAFTDGERLGIQRSKNLQFKKDHISEAYRQMELELIKKKMARTEDQHRKRHKDIMYQ